MIRAFELLRCAGVTAAAEPENADVVELLLNAKRAVLAVPGFGARVEFTGATPRSAGTRVQLAFVVSLPPTKPSDISKVHVYMYLRLKPDNAHGDLDLTSSVVHGIDLVKNPKATASEILSLCFKDIRDVYLPKKHSAHAAAEPQTTDPFDDHGFSKLWLQYMPHAGKVTAGGVTVTLESFDSAPVSIEITMPDGDQYSVEESSHDDYPPKDTQNWHVRIWHVGQRKAAFPHIPGNTPAKQMLQRILTLCITDWKKHKAATAAAEPATSMSPAQALARYYDLYPSTRELGNGVTVTPARRPGKGLDIELGNQCYHAHPNYLGDSSDVRVEITTPLHVNKGRAIVVVTDVTGVPDLLRQIIKPILDRRPGNHHARKAQP